MVVLNLLVFENKKYTAYDCFNGNSSYGKIKTKKEPIRMLRFTSRLHVPCHIIMLTTAIVSYGSHRGKTFGFLFSFFCFVLLV